MANKLELKESLKTELFYIRKRMTKREAVRYGANKYSDRINKNELLVQSQLAMLTRMKYAWEKIGYLKMTFTANYSMEEKHPSILRFIGFTVMLLIGQKVMVELFMLSGTH